jgi:hypothetical protein
VAGWFSKAARSLRPSAPPPAQPFDIPCECGESFTGWRTPAPQKLSCIQCDRTLLILPADVYPAVERVLSTPLVKSPPSVVADETTEPAAKKSGKKSKKSRGKKDEAKAPEAKGKKSATAPDDRIEIAPALREGQMRRRMFRLVFVAILALVGVTSWKLWQRNLQERARAALPGAMEAGLAALRAGEFSTAARELTRAVQHLDTLRQDDAAARTIRQARREAVAADDLSPDGLSDLAALMLTGAGSEEDRQRRFQIASGTKWLIFDAGIVRRVADGDVTIYELDVPLTVDDKTLQALCDFPSLRRRLSDADPLSPVRAIFAAQIEEWLMPDTEHRPIIARLRPATAFLWSDYDSYAAAGYEPDTPAAEQETRTLLEQQREVEMTR